MPVKKSEWMMRGGMEFFLTEEGITSVGEANRAAREYRKEKLYVRLITRRNGLIDVYTAPGRVLGIAPDYEEEHSGPSTILRLA